MKLDFCVRVARNLPNKGRVTFDASLKSAEERDAFISDLDTQVPGFEVCVQWTQYVSHSAAEAKHEMDRNIRIQNGGA